jgi:hypothetical protein
MGTNLGGLIGILAFFVPLLILLWLLRGKT